MNKNRKPKILIFSDYYLPGYKSGGGMRTIVNMVDRLYKKYDFRIVTRDHDGRQDKTQYKNVEINDWNQIGEAKVFYLSKNSIKLSKIRELILDVKPDLIYTNSYFATLSIFVMVLRRLNKIPTLNVVIANCGEFSDAALQLKSSKKKLFIKFSKKTGLHKNVLWKASSVIEKEEIKKIKGSGGRIFIAPDLPAKRLNYEMLFEEKPEKVEGIAEMVFLSRFMRKKNFKWLLENLTDIKGNLKIDVIAPIEDENYWQECLKKIEGLPKNIFVKYLGSVPHEKVCETLLKYHFFILPTISENFGHVFLEAMSAGCPLIISDRTPWLDLEEKGIGWDIPLENPDRWLKVINDCIKMRNEDFKKLSTQAKNYVERWLADEKIEEDTIKILEYGLKG